jgi:hypothetical protein
MKAIKIDVIKKDVYEINVNKGNEDMYKHLNCDLFTLPIILDNEDGLYVDDEALLREPEDQHGAFMFADYPSQYLFGHGLITGCDNKGEQTDALSDLETIKSKVEFLDNDKIEEIQNNLLTRGFYIYEK